MGQLIQTLTFTNRSGSPCQLGGWPGFQAVDAAGEPQAVPNKLVRQNAAPQPIWTAVDLTPGSRASFDVYGGDYNPVQQHACPTTSGAVIELPGSTSKLRVSLRIPDCGTFYVAPVVPGASDRKAWSQVVS